MEFDQSKIIQECTRINVTWKFNPPAAPHMGGCWERLVRSVKTSLKAILTKRAPRLEVLTTLFTEAESFVNSRPLTFVSVDPHDEESLTPNHFLLGNSGGVKSPGVFNDDDFSLRRQWRISQRLTDMFWKRWVKEYLPTLTRRTKWFNKDINAIKVNDLVIIADENAWPRGIIVGVFPDKDGKIRMVDVKTNNGIFRRPICKICVLGINTS